MECDPYVVYVAGRYFNGQAVTAPVPYSLTLWRAIKAGVAQPIDWGNAPWELVAEFEEYIEQEQKAQKREQDRQRAQQRRR